MVEAVLTTAAVVAAAGVILGAMVKIYRGVNRAVDWIEQVHAVTTRELQSNGGASLKDQVYTVQRDLHEYAVMFTAHVSDNHGPSTNPVLDR